MVQANLVAAALLRVGARASIVVIETEGDRRTTDLAWGDGVFVAAIERELLAGRIDVGVHSAKDLPTALDRRLSIAAFLPRADPRDALVVRDGLNGRLDELPAGASVGTDSPRRTGFLLAHRPDLDVRPIHGNVDTRLRRMDAGEVDALVLAAAGLDRLGLANRIGERLDPVLVPPAPGQGAIAVQARFDDPLVMLLSKIDDADTRRAVEAERDLLAACGGGCRSPIGALALAAGDRVAIQAGRVAIDGTGARSGRRSGPADAVRQMVADLAAVVSAPGPWRPETAGAGRPGRPRVIVTRPEGQAGALMDALRDVALDPIPTPTIKVHLGAPDGPLDRALPWIGSFAWVAITSANGARALLAAAERIFTPFEATRLAAVGLQTRMALEAEGVDVAFQPTVATASDLGRQLPITAGDEVLVVRGSTGGAELPEMLVARGAVVHEVVAYTTEEAPPEFGRRLRQAFGEGPVAAAVFTSGSTVRGLVRLAATESIRVGGLPAICIGPETAAAAAAAGFEVVGVAESTEPAVLAETAARAIRVRLPAPPLAPAGGSPR